MASAGRPRKVATESVENLTNEVSQSTPETPETETDKVAQLEKKVDTLTDLFAQFMKHEMSKSEPVQSSPVNNNVNQKTPVKLNSTVDSDEEDELNNIVIDPVTYIKVMSLDPGLLCLATAEPKNHPKYFTFKKFGEVKRILYSDLNNIIEIDERFLQEGRFIILNRSVVRKHGFDETYSKILTKDKIDQILYGENQTDAVNLFKSTNETQQKNICNLILQKLVDGESLDLNLVDRISREWGKIIDDDQYSLVKKAEESKQLIKLYKKENEVKEEKEE